MTIRQVRNVLWAALLVIFCVFVFIWEKKDVAVHQNSVAEGAVVIAPSLWNLDAVGPVEYLKIACRLHNFENITIYAVLDKPFLEIQGYEPGAIEKFLETVGLIFKTNLETVIEYNGHKIGKISAVHRHDTIYVYLQLLLILGFTSLIIHFFYRTALSKKTLEIRVAERTKELAQSTERLDLALNGADLGLWDWDMTTDQIYFSRRYLSMLGYEYNELPLVTQTWEDLLHPDDKEKSKQHIIDCLAKKGAQWSMEFRLRHKDGTYRWILGRGKVVEYDKNGNAVRAAGTHLDIDDQKHTASVKTKLESELNQAQKMEAIGTLAGGIAHDFNNILSAIFGYNELSMMHVNTPDKLRRDIEGVQKGAQRAKDLVYQILTFSRKGEQNRQPLQLAVVINDALKMLRSTIPTTIEIKKNIDATDMVLADQTQVHQILMNLCTNAYHAMAETGGTLGVALQRFAVTGEEHVPRLDLAKGTYLRLEVSDTGKGMEQETKKRIFDPYFTTKKQGDGTGLGLAVVHGIVKDYNGHICVYSEPGAGTTFHVYLPVIESAHASITEVPDELELVGGVEQIMVVDDEEEITAVLEEILLQYGYKVDIFSNGLQALQDFQKNPYKYDLVITDMTMPYMTGSELSRKLIETRPEIPIILCTGYSDIINKEKVELIGIRNFMQKPFYAKKLVRDIRIILDDIA